MQELNVVGKLQAVAGMPSGLIQYQYYSVVAVMGGELLQKLIHRICIAKGTNDRVTISGLW